MKIQKLNTKAIDNHGNRYDVELQTRENDKPVLRILGTPGGWYLNGLQNKTLRDVISIDHGQGWDCINLQEILAEANEVDMADLRARMIASEQSMSDEARAEQAFEMRAAFGPGETVVNILTGTKYTT